MAAIGCKAQADRRESSLANRMALLMDLALIRVHFRNAESLNFLSLEEIALAYNVDEFQPSLPS